MAEEAAAQTQTKQKPEKDKKTGNWLATINGHEGYFNRNQIEVAMKSVQQDVDLPKNTSFSTNVQANKCRTCGGKK